MEQHGIHMAETMFYDVYPERDPEEMLTKFVTTADKIESACPQRLESFEELTNLKGGSDEPAIGAGETAESSGVLSMMKASAYTTGMFWRLRATSDALRTQARRCMRGVLTTSHYVNVK